MLSTLSRYPDIMIFIVTAERTSILAFSLLALVFCAELHFVLGGSPLRLQLVSRLSQAVTFLTYVLEVLGSNLVLTLSILSFLSSSWQMPRHGLKLGHGHLLFHPLQFILHCYSTLMLSELLKAGLNPDFR
jgi:hypothetical protein